MVLFYEKNTTEKCEARMEIRTVVDHLKVELLVAVYFYKMLHRYDETQLQYRQTLYTIHQSMPIRASTVFSAVGITVV